MAIDANTGAVLHNKSGDTACYPASLTKMMTLYMTFELIELGRLSYTTKIKMTPTAAAAPPSKLNLKPGEELTVLNAIKALITKSANDVAAALAEHIGGSEGNFARLMTRRARQLGMNSTIFKNASGLPNGGQKTTARDMLKLALHLQDHFPQHYKLFSTRHFTYRGRRYRNHNALLRRYRGTDGIKTGYTRASGFNLVSSVRRDGKHVVAVVFGGKSSRVRNAKMRSILNKALTKASRRKTRKPVLVSRAASPMAPRPRLAARKAPLRPAERFLPPPAVTAATPPQSAPQLRRATQPSIHVAKVRPLPLPPGALRDTIRPEEGDNGHAEVKTVYRPAKTSNLDVDAVMRFAPPKGALSGGLPPSTSHTQVGASSARPQPQTGPAGKNAAGASGPFQIQIGAYIAPADAEYQMAHARERSGGLLDPYRAVAIPVQNGRRQLYRARFQGFERTAAYSTCASLRRLQIDCFVLRMQ
jgi:D-alanyl-D-alanine carboxypeptidase